MRHTLEQIIITDIIEMYSNKRLFLSPEFQRRSVWTPAARTYLIDSILRDYPIPKVYFRTKLELIAQTSIREVVDGQQRLRAIIDFAKDKLILGSRANEYKGKVFSTLDSQSQTNFLSYPLSFEQLINASDEDVLEVFSRLNTYGWLLNSQEKRHAKFQGEFRWVVYTSAKDWSILWEKYNVVSVRNRVRMQDDKLIAEMYGALLEGVIGGESRKINSLYKKYDNVLPGKNATSKFNECLKFIVNNFVEPLSGTPILKSPHFLLLFSSVCHAMYGIPNGVELIADSPEHLIFNATPLSDINICTENLRKLSSIIESSELVEGFNKFWLASHSTTHSYQSRATRFQYYFRALLPIEM